MKIFVRNSISILEEIFDHMCEDHLLMEGAPSKLTPFQKAQRNRRQTVGMHTVDPTKQSTFYQHAVRAIFMNLRKHGESFKGSAKGGQNIAKHMLRKNGYGTGQPSGNVKLTGKGRKRNRMHSAEPPHIKKKKQSAYDYIMGIQRRKAVRKANVARKAASAG
jgi:hypothetical protein